MPGKADNPKDRKAQVGAAFRQDYPGYQYRFVEFFVEHLADVSQTFRGDLQQVLVLAIIGQVRLRALSAATASGDDPERVPHNKTSISASRLADVTGIPRETVRRKLALLERRGWVVRSAEFGWRLAVDGAEVPARSALSELDERAIERVARLFTDLETIVGHMP